MKINISTIIEAIEMADDNFTFFLSDKNIYTFKTPQKNLCDRTEALRQ
ncbi:TPA: hypothetical protein KRE09_004531 [Clostridioides difficile]|nr:hypothetical protein [Clostridioides difficile]HBF8342588.1 hypothetical protein [Clostridioides difficile]HBF8345582.1 hypothetical protein [Clostridioides difficile]HBG7323061.1 hypothetical protein [Clostridioides difficile]HBG7324325.1 hypothetical protein [Clostridioides difficile]HBG7330695.1 hypothetical protein [Clostridioides difficile]